MSHAKMDLKVVALDRTYGGVTIDTLVKWAMEGRITSDDLVRTAGSDHWVSVTQVPELAASLPRGVAAAPATDGQPQGEFEAIAAEESDEAEQWTVKRPSRRAEEAEMDMTPMIDVTFQLLIFFMLTNNLANPAPMLVPEAVHGRGLDPQGRQMVLLDENGKYYLGDRAETENIASSLDALAQEVARNAAAADRPMDVIVSAHKTARYVQVRELVERLGGISNLGDVMLGVEEKK
ncbi:MAG TPA: biopolymer transporter ExbD [Pirellulales bacterium]|nr:biopolymer transporter ExbD [Pirellulales bacterium]